jgi:hypothetical protein
MFTVLLILTEASYRKEKCETETLLGAARRLADRFAFYGIATLNVVHAGFPFVAVATNLAHDGIASPVASLESYGRKRSFGVQIPIAVFVDIDFVEA